MRKIKLIWDFRGSVAEKTAEHHHIHLKEYVNNNQLDITISGFEVINEFHSIAFMVVTDNELIEIRDTLKPNRGELYEQ